MNKDFENGREFNRLELQITELNLEILQRSGKNNPAQQTRLRNVLREAFQTYTAMAMQYQIYDRKIGELYNEAMDSDKK